MNLNILAYGIYTITTFFIIAVVGQVFYRNGRLFILGLLHNDEDTTDRINHLLLVGYYLFNLGYALLRIRNWQPVTTLPFLIESLAGTISAIIILLSLMHYGNMLALWLYAGNHKSIAKSSIP